MTAYESACGEAPPPALLTGIDEFNRGAYFQCHETLEALWLQTRGPIRELYQGILQVGVGLYHAERGNARGARLTLRRGLERLRPLSTVCQDVHVALLVEDGERALTELEAGIEKGRRTGVPLLAPSAIPMIRLVARNPGTSTGT